MKAALVLFALLFLPALAQATDVTVSWAAPTKYEDTTSIAAGTVISYKVYGALSGVPKQLLTTVTTLSTVRAAVAPGNQCYTVSAVVAGIESAQSPESCKTVSAPAPQAPGAPTLTLTPTGPTAYSVIKSQDALVMLPIGTVNTSASCDASQGVLLAGKVYNPVPSASVKFTGSARPIVVFALCG